MSTFHRVTVWIKYRCTARSRHGVHSPFVYHFVENVLCGRSGKARKEALVQYFESYEVTFGDWALASPCTEHSLIILPGIHQSKLNTQRWNALIENPRIRLSIDIYEYGLLLFKNDFKEKQHFVVKG